MNNFDNSLKVKDALPIYFARYHFKDGGYYSKWFKIKLGPVNIPLPNVKTRVDAVKIHDIHHLVTEYEANMKGEVEIGGWEIGSGCGKYIAAWVLNFGSFLYGMLFYPQTLLRAFLKGRRCKTNLYYNFVYDESLLNKSVGELREIILPDTTTNPVTDYFLFTLCCLVSLLPAMVFFVSLYLLFALVF